MELFVSFSEIIGYFKRNILKFIIILAVFGIVFGLMPLKFVSHEYSADTTIIVSCEVPENAQTDYRLQYTSILSSRVQTAVALASGNDIIEQTATKLNIDKKSIISITAVQVGTAPVVKITANSADAGLVESVANTAAQVLSEKLTDAFPSPKLSAVVSDKAIPAVPQSDRSAILKAGILGLIMGFIVYVCFGIIVVMTDKTIRNSRYVSEALKTKLLGTVPQKGGEEKKGDSFRKLRAAAVNQAGGGKSFLVTDVCKHNGASIVAAGFASTLALSGRTVILIDADLHGHSMTKALNVKSEKNLSDVLSGICTAEHAITQTAVTGLSVIAGADSTAQNPADILSSVRFEGLVKELSEKFDYIVSYAPSEVHYPDADNIAKLFDSVIMTAKYGSTPYNEFKDSFHRLETVGGNIIGFVTTNI